MWLHAALGPSGYNVGAKGATVHEALALRHHGIFFARGSCSTSRIACLP